MSLEHVINISRLQVKQVKECPAVAIIHGQFQTFGMLCDKEIHILICKLNMDKVFQMMTINFQV